MYSIPNTLSYFPLIPRLPPIQRLYITNGTILYFSTLLSGSVHLHKLTKLKQKTKKTQLYNKIGC